jgi:hypothetical protein
MGLLRVLFGCLYLLASMANLLVLWISPGAYHSFARTALLPFYRDFILANGGSLLPWLVFFLVLYQSVAGLLILHKGPSVRIGFYLASFFLVIILPLGMEILPNIIFMFFQLWLARREFEHSYLDGWWAKLTYRLGIKLFSPSEQ